MDSVHPYLLRLLAEFEQIAKWNYFEPIAAVAVFFIFFIIGRKSYQSKFSQVLNTINDCENQKRRLTDLSQRRQQSLRQLNKRISFFQMITLLIVLSLAAYTYIKKFQPFVVAIAIIGLILMWTTVLLRRKYLQIMIKSTEASLQKKLLSSQTDAKEIIALLGDEVCKQLKTKFQRELDVQWRTEQLKDCDLRKCDEQKKVYQQLYQLYMDIMSEMRLMQWCDTCSQMLNTDSNEIKLTDLDNKLKNYKSISQKLSLQKKKQLTNRLLQQWQRLEGKLPFVCKRGCCIRFRNCLDNIKKTMHDKLKSLKSRLALLK